MLSPLRPVYSCVISCAQSVPLRPRPMLGTPVFLLMLIPAVSSARLLVAQRGSWR